MYRTSPQIEFGMALLAAIFPECSRLQLPNQTVEGRTVHGLRLRGGTSSDGQRRGVLLVGGTHARELMNPDLLLELAAELLVAYDDGAGITHGGRTWTATQVRLIMEVLDVYVVPNINPDGRQHSLNTFKMWRKNRRDNPGSPCDGVDLNRNLDVLWGVTEGSISCNPCSDVYCGPGAFSEPETANVKWILDTRRIDCFADVHSYSELILYPWGHAPTQTVDSSQRFTSLPSGTCAPIADPAYAEYMPPADLQRYQAVSQRVVEAIKDVRGRVYTPQPGIDLYATTGTHGDYAYARHVADPSLRKTYGFTFETGPLQGTAEESFQPADPEPIKEEARSGLMALLVQCVCAIDLLGTRFLEGAERPGAGMRRLRDEVLGGSEAGRAWTGMFERHQAELAALVLEDPELGERAAGLVEAVDALLRGERDSLDEEEVTQARELAEALREQEISDDLRRDLAAVEDRLERVAGRGREALVEELLSRGPRDDDRPDKSG